MTPPAKNNSSQAEGVTFYRFDFSIELDLECMRQVERKERKRNLKRRRKEMTDLLKLCYMEGMLDQS